MIQPAAPIRCPVSLVLVVAASAVQAAALALIVSQAVPREERVRLATRATAAGAPVLLEEVVVTAPRVTF